jgi:hypothetical protein
LFSRGWLLVPTIPLLGASYEAFKKNLRWKLARIRSTEERIDYGGVSMPKPSWRNFMVVVFNRRG